MGLGFVLPIVIWQYDHLLPYVLVLFEAGMLIGVD